MDAVERRHLRPVDDTSVAQSTVHVGAVLRRHREACELTQEQAAVRAGITRNTIVALEGQRFPETHLSTLLALMLAYELGSIEHLLGSVPSAEMARQWEKADWIGGKPHRSRRSAGGS